MILQKCSKMQHFLTSFGVEAVWLKEKVKKGAYTHIKNKWWSSKKKIQLNVQVQISKSNISPKLYKI